MNESPLIPELKAHLGARALSVEQTSKDNIFVGIRPEDVPDCVRILWNDMQGRWGILTGIDVVGGIDLLYHFIFDAHHVIVTLKTTAEKPDPRIESVTPLIPGAEWIEREVMDLLGVTFVNHPRPERLILADDWPAGVYPLRKDYRLKDPSA